MLPARSRPADAPVKAKALYRARVGSVGVATPCAEPPTAQRTEGGEPLLDRGMTELSRDWGSCRDGCWRMRIIGRLEALPP